MFRAKTNWKRAGICFLLIAVLCLSACTATPSSGEDQTTTTTTTTNQPETKPSTDGGNVMKDASIYYCAVGKVDTAKKTAKVLFDDGSIATITYTGDAPEAGQVNTFKKEGDTYSVVKSRTFPSFGDGFKTMGITYVSARQKRFQLGGNIYYVTDETAFFVRYSATEWRVYKGRDAMINDSGYAGGEGTRAYFYYEAPFADEISNCRVVRYAMIVGNYAAKGKWPAATAGKTSFLDPENKGWNKGDKILA